MNGFHRNPPSSLGEDVLLLIFEYLDEGDLCKCEDVCQQWRTIFKAGIPWRRLLRRRVALSDMWRQAWLSMGLDEMTVPREHFRTICSAIVRYSREMNKKFINKDFAITHHTIRINPPNSQLLRYGMEKDYISIEALDATNHRKSIHFLDKATMKITHSLLLPHEAATKSVTLLRGDMFLLQTLTWIQFYDKNTGQVLHRLEEDTDWVIQGCILTDKLLTVHSNNMETKTSRLRFWQMENPFTLTYLKEITFDNELSEPLSGDDKFLCIYQYVQGFREDSRRLVQFVSTKTLKIKTSLSCTADRMKYEGGLFFTWTKDKLVQLLDVASGAFLWRTREPFNFRSFPYILKSNSKYLVSIEHKIPSGISVIKVFDLHDIKDPYSTCVNAHLTRFEMPPTFDDCLLDETRLILANSYWCKIVVLNFGVYDRFNYLSPATWHSKD